MKFKVTRKVIVSSTETWEVESEQELINRLNNDKSLAGEISELGLARAGRVPRTIKYSFLKDEIKQIKE